MNLINKINPFSRSNSFKATEIKLREEEKKEVKKAMGLIAKIVQNAESITRKDIDDWKQAWELALWHERPRRYRLMDIYRTAMVDNHLSAAVQNRKMKVLRQKWKVIDRETGEEDEERTELLTRPWFRQFTSLALDARFYGHSLIQFGDLVGGQFHRVQLVNRSHVVPELGLFLIEKTDENSKGIDYRQPPYSNWVLEVGDPYDLGLLLKATPQAIAKKNMMLFWDDFGEIFGSPMRYGTTNTRDKKVLDQLESALETMGQAAYAVIPEGAQISLLENNRPDAYQIYDKRIDRCNSEISKLINGQTMTMDNGSSKSQSEVHERVGDQIIQADKDDLRDVVNTVLFPFLSMHGYDLDGYEWVYDETEQVSIQEQWKIDSGLLAHFDIDPAYFEEKYNVPIIGAKAPQPPAGPGNNNQEEDGEES